MSSPTPTMKWTMDAAGQWVRRPFVRTGNTDKPLEISK